MRLSSGECEARGRQGLLLGDGLPRGHFGKEGRLVTRRRRLLLVMPVGLVAGRPSLERLRSPGRRLRAVSVFVVVVATGSESESVVVAVLVATVVAIRLAREAVLAPIQRQERSLAERAALVWTAVWVVQSAAVLALRSAMRRWWSAREHLALPWRLHCSFTRDLHRHSDT